MNIPIAGWVGKIAKIDKLIPDELLTLLKTQGVNLAKQLNTKTRNAQLRVLQQCAELLEIFAKGKQAIKEFFTKLGDDIGRWFTNNKEKFKNTLKKIKEYLSKSRKARFRTTKMLRKYVGEETGNGWCAPSVVKYLDEIERAKFELAIIDGKLYTANGKLFDTTKVRTISGELKAIFVMTKDGKIYASLSHYRGVFHHSSFLAGGEVAAAGELKVINGLIEFVSKQSGHYQPTSRYMKQFMKLLEENGIDVNKISVDF